MPERIPTTRKSLLVRIRNRDDLQSWSEFESIYRPAVYRLARRRGLQASDAEDLAQQVMLSVTRKVPDWQTDSGNGSFRAWLLTVTRNAITNHLVRRRPDVAEGGSGFLSNAIDPRNEQSMDRAIDWEFRRAAFRQAANDIKREFRSETWDCFWLTAVLRKPAQDTAQKLGLRVGAVYTNKSRVLKRLREHIAALDITASESGPLSARTEINPDQQENQT